MYWINYYESCNPIIGYNLKQGGCCNVNKETKIKLSKAHKNKAGPNTNKVSIQRNYQRKFIFKEDLDKYLKEGWRLGNKKSKQHDKNQHESLKKVFIISLKNDVYKVRGHQEVLDLTYKLCGTSISNSQLKEILRHNKPWHPKLLKYKKLDGIYIRLGGDE